MDLWRACAEMPPMSGAAPSCGAPSEIGSCSPKGNRCRRAAAPRRTLTEVSRLGTEEDWTGSNVLVQGEDWTGSDVWVQGEDWTGSDVWVQGEGRGLD